MPPSPPWTFHVSRNPRWLLTHQECIGLRSVPVTFAFLSACGGGEPDSECSGTSEGEPATGVVRVAHERRYDSDLRVHLTLNANNAGHGQPFAATLECDAPDRGELVVPAALVDSFPDQQAPSGLCAGSDCPPSSLVRYRATRLERSDLEVQLRAESAVMFGIEHRGECGRPRIHPGYIQASPWAWPGG